MAGLHGRDGTSQHLHLGIYLVDVYVGQKRGNAPGIGAAAAAAAFLVVGGQQLVFVAGTVGGREVGAG